jgi:hypothetical protein
VLAVPNVTGESFREAYAELHRDGLNVTFTHAFSLDWSGECLPRVTSTAPARGRSVPRNRIITLTGTSSMCGAASPGQPTPLPGPYRVPSFLGKPLPAAIKWVKAHQLSWAATIPALHKGRAASLYANYVITAQSPRPGDNLTVGVTTSSGGWLPTPLKLKVRAN